MMLKPSLGLGRTFKGGGFGLTVRHVHSMLHLGAPLNAISGIFYSCCVVVLIGLGPNIMQYYF